MDPSQQEMMAVLESAPFERVGGLQAVPRTVHPIHETFMSILNGGSEKEKIKRSSTLRRINY